MVDRVDPATPRLPSVSIVTACRNARPTIEHTLRSVLQTDHPGLEYVVVDAASSDGTGEMLEAWRPRLARLIREPDDGQYHGIAKGFAHTGGEVMGWLNADDTYFPWTIRLVAEIFAAHPDIDWIIGAPAYMDAGGRCTRLSGTAGVAYPRQQIRDGWFRERYAGWLQQESMFWRRRLWDRVGGLDLRLSLAADFDLWRRFAEHAPLVAVAAPLALFRQSPGVQRSSVHRDRYQQEVEAVCAPLRQPPLWWRALSSRGTVGIQLARFVQWRRADVIAHDAIDDRWRRIDVLRPLSRATWSDLTMARALRK